MAKKDRDYDTIINGCTEMEQEISDLQKAAKALHTGADSAEATLKDRVGKKDIDSVQKLADTISKVTASGLERVQELKRKVIQEKQEFDEL